MDGMMSNRSAARNTFNSHLLSLEEVWYTRDHPFNQHVVKVRRAAKFVEALEAQLETARAHLAEEVAAMNAARAQGT